jgi:hypothetical protein
MQLAPGPASFGAVFLDQPLAGSTELQACAVHQQVNRPSGASTWYWHLQRLGAAAQGRMIRDSEINAQEPQDRADQAFGLTQCQPEHRPECQGRLDGQNRIAGLTAAGRTGLGIPGCDRFFGKPHRQASALAQGSIVLRPVRHPVPLLGDVTTAGGIGLEGHDRDLCSDTKQASTLPRPGYQTPSMQQGGFSSGTVNLTEQRLFSAVLSYPATGLSD